MAEHRWSGWPGAWCLDCGSPDLTEQGLDCAVCVCDPERNELFICEDHRNADCPEPGSNRHNPYTTHAAASGESA